MIFSILQCSLTLSTTFKPQNETLIALEYQSLHYFGYLKNSTTKVTSYFKLSKIFFKLFIIRFQNVMLYSVKKHMFVFNK